MKNILLIVLVFLVSCQSINETPKPDKLIDSETMVDILVDLSLIDAAKRLNRRDLDVKELEVKEFVYNKYGIDSAQLASNTAYYSNRTKLFSPIFDSVQNRLEFIKQELDTLKKEKDSLDALLEEENKDSLKLNLDIPQKIKLQLADSLKPSLKLNKLEKPSQ